MSERVSMALDAKDRRNVTRLRIHFQQRAVDEGQPLHISTRKLFQLGLLALAAQESVTIEE